MKRKVSLFVLSFMMVLVLFNLGMAQAEELQYKYTVSESLGTEKETISWYNFDKKEAIEHEIEFTIVPDGATLKLISEPEWYNAFIFVAE